MELVTTRIPDPGFGGVQFFQGEQWEEIPIARDEHEEIQEDDRQDELGAIFPISFPVGYHLCVVSLELCSFLISFQNYDVIDL